jgi:hypothetical protein
MKAVQNVTPEMETLINEIRAKKKRLNEDIFIGEDFRPWDFPISAVWRAGAERKTLWEYNSDRSAYYFAGSEEEVIENLKEVLEHSN